MRFKTMSRSDAQIAMQEWIGSDGIPVVETEYINIRNKMLELYEAIDLNFTKDYDKDLMFGLSIYEIINKIDGFGMRIAADDGFWMYLSLRVVPDIVSKRWGKDNESHFWQRPTRIWLRSIWWYIHLSWQGNTDSTCDILKYNTTDEILNLVERAGRKGYNIITYRNIMYYYSKVSMEIKRNYNKDKRDSIFRRIMVLNTAYTQIMEPALYEGKEKGYVKSLYHALGISFEE